MCTVQEIVNWTLPLSILPRYTIGYTCRSIALTSMFTKLLGMESSLDAVTRISIVDGQHADDV